MTYIPLPNIACIAGLIAGATLILGADIARADVRSCSEDEAGRYESDETLPVMCDVMTVTGKRVETPRLEVARLDADQFGNTDDLKDENGLALEPVSWSTTVTY